MDVISIGITMLVCHAQLVGVIGAWLCLWWIVLSLSKTSKGER